jgi:hypothetical protein
MDEILGSAVHSSLPFNSLHFKQSFFILVFPTTRSIVVLALAVASWVDHRFALALLSRAAAAAAAAACPPVRGSSEGLVVNVSAADNGLVVNVSAADNGLVVLRARFHRNWLPLSHIGVPALPLWRSTTRLRDHLAGWQWQRTVLSGF